VSWLVALSNQIVEELGRQVDAGNDKAGARFRREPEYLAEIAINRQ
jgi:hypothetical protein